MARFLPFPFRMTEPAERNKPGKLRLTIASLFTRVEDGVYVGLGALLALSAAALLVNVAIGLGKSILAGAPAQSIVDLLDRMLLILMIVEVLYTVQVSFREHTLVPEPFLIVGLIAVTRRILVLTAQFATLFEKGNTEAFQSAMLELALLTLMVVALVVSLRILRKRAQELPSKVGN
jgi:uncharacterized membrane protein (DUF373 family)